MEKTENKQQVTTNKPEVQTSILPVLEKMEIGDVVFFPLERRNTVRSTLGSVKPIGKKKFQTISHNGDELLEVIRIA